MLPDFPALKRERISKILRYCFDMSRAKHGVLPQLRQIRQHEGIEAEMRDVDGQVLDAGFQTLQSSLEIRAADLPGLGDDRWIALVGEATDSVANQQMQQFLQKLDETAKRTGNLIRTEGEPLSEEHILDMLDNVTLDFQKGEVAPGFAFLVSPEVGKKLAALEVSEDAKRRHDAIIERQRVEWRFREANRKLVD